MSRCNALSSGYRPCKRKAMDSGRCAAHDGHDFDRYDPGEPRRCQCMRPWWVTGADERIVCLSCGRRPLHSADELRDWRRRWPEADLEALAAVLRGRVLVRTIVSRFKALELTPAYEVPRESTSVGERR